MRSKISRAGATEVTSFLAERRASSMKTVSVRARMVAVRRSPATAPTSPKKSPSPRVITRGGASGRR